MINIYIISSLAQQKNIQALADTLGGSVRYVKPEPDKSFAECVSNCFDNIEWADIIYALPKPDGTFGEGVTYELEYAKRLGKKNQNHIKKYTHRNFNGCIFLYQTFLYR